ncbi:MAG: hypothetical protein CSA09_01895 [Candidatus Contendobacter odensis]|uniref:Fibronectin type-III domain-containing protein n=1 Tax=Candidatus Contendibacter odensensis TaxID=1400860 RepID=A0A2G6PGC3_9GAMM|nr:MAG: hypothetical protein CSA09_01895 [Candidatus Contendobacter odensis]
MSPHPFIQTAEAQAYLESPISETFFESGVGLVRGWVCDAERVEISIDGGERRLAAYGTKRGDTQSICGDTDNGFGLTFNWNQIGDGVHNIKAYADGVQFADTHFTVTTLGENFIHGLKGQFKLKDFPAAGSSPSVRWSEPHQNFVFVNQTAVPAVAKPPVAPGTFLESPSQGSSESGIGLIRGWVCDAERVEISIDGGALRPTAYGTKRGDTQSLCGDDNNGFGLTFNWNSISDGVHNLKAYADGVLFANVNFAVATLGQDFITGVGGSFALPDFPSKKQHTIIRWSEPHQNFLIKTTTATGEKIATVSAVTDRRNDFAVMGLGSGLLESIGVYVAKGASGETTAVNGTAWTDTTTGQAADVSLAANGLPAVYTDSNGVKAQFSNYDTAANTVTVSFTDADGNSLGAPVDNTPVETGLLKPLQDLVSRVRGATQPARQGEDDGTSMRMLAPVETAQVNNAISRFSLKALLANMAFSGAVATGEALCAVKTAAERLSLSRIVAPQACQSPLLRSFAGLAQARIPQADNSDDNLPPAIAQRLNFGEDISEAPCQDNSDRIACLQSATQAAISEQSQPPIPVASPETDNSNTLATPSHVSASDGSFADFIRVSWNTVEGASSYEIYRSGITNDINTLVGTTTSGFYDDTSVKLDLVYFYSVKACNDSGCSPLSNSDSGYAEKEELERFTAKATAGPGGHISPASRMVDAGETTSFTITHEYGYELMSVKGCNGNKIVGPLDFLNRKLTYTTGAITQNCTVNATFRRAFVLVSTSAGPGGSISPDSQPVNVGDTARFTVTHDNGYMIESVTGCGGTLAEDNVYTTGVIHEDCTITANFTQANYLISTSAGPGGSISPGSQTVNAGDTARFTVTHDNGYMIESVTGCGGTLRGNVYTTGAIHEDCTITASFTQANYLISTSAGPGGSISPGSQTVNAGDTASFTVTHDNGYMIESVTGCGGTLAEDNVYTTGAIHEDCTITAYFTHATFLVSTSTNLGGTISPTSQTVDAGDTASFTVTHDYGYIIGSVTGCGGTLAENNVYTTGVIDEDCTITVHFHSTITAP